MRGTRRTEFREGICNPSWPARAELTATVFDRALTPDEACLQIANLFKIRTLEDDRARQLLANCEAYGFCQWDNTSQVWVRSQPKAPAIQGASAWEGYVSPSCGSMLSGGMWLPPPTQPSPCALKPRGGPHPWKSHWKDARVQ